MFNINFKEGVKMDKKIDWDYVESGKTTHTKKAQKKCVVCFKHIDKCECRMLG